MRKKRDEEGKPGKSGQVFDVAAIAIDGERDEVEGVEGDAGRQERGTEQLKCRARLRIETEDAADQETEIFVIDQRESGRQNGEGEQRTVADASRRAGQGINPEYFDAEHNRM